MWSLRVASHLLKSYVSKRDKRGLLRDIARD
jgi:hypothetical protein